MAPEKGLPANARGWIAPAVGVLGGAAMGFVADDVADWIIGNTPGFPYRKYVLPIGFIVGGVTLAAAGVKLGNVPKVILMALGTFLAMVGFKFLDADRRPILTKATTAWLGGNTFSVKYASGMGQIGLGSSAQAISGTLAANSNLYEVKTLAL